jgi:putative MATE family efflux protein
MREKWNSRVLFQLLWPLIVEQILSVTVGMADTVMITVVGEHAVSGISLVDQISILLILAFGALATGGSVVISQYIGRRDAKKASDAAKQLIYASAVVSFGLMIFAVAFKTPVLRFIYGSIEGDVMEAAETYFFISALSYPALAIYNAAAALFRSMGNSRVTMAASIVMNLVNIGGNAALIYGLHMGVEGAALSTLASRIIAGLILMVLLVRGRRNTVSLKGLFRVKFEPYLMNNILKIGVPSAIENSVFQLGKLLVSRIATDFGTSAIAANAITGVINSFAMMPAGAFGLAMLTIVGQCIGAEDYDGAKFFTRRLMILVYAEVAVFSIFTLVFLNPIIGIFSLSPDAQDMTRQFVWVLTIMSVIAWPPAFTLPNALRAAGDVRYVMVVSIVIMWLVRVIGSYIYAYALGFGVIGIWYGMVTDWCVRTVFYVIRWNRGRWREKNVLTG